MILLKKIISFFSVLLFVGFNQREKIQFAHENLKRSNNLKNIDKIKFEIEKKKNWIWFKKIKFIHRKFQWHKKLWKNLKSNITSRFNS